MKSLLSLIIGLSVFSFPVEVFSSNIVPRVSVSASSSAVTMKSVNIVNGSGLDKMDVTAVHDAASDGSTMWRSNTPLSDIRLVFDLAQEYRLNEVYIWNYNQPGATSNGLKNISIEYSCDKSEWQVLPAAVSPGYEVDAAYPFMLQQANGVKGLPATNLADGKGTPIDMKGVTARYVRFTASKVSGVGNWGGKAFGLSEVMFTTSDAVDNSYAVSVYPNEKEKKFGNMIFGGCQIPSLPHLPQILPQMVDFGFNNIRCDVWLESVVPQNITYEGYLNNVGDAQNPDTWNFANLEQAVRAKKAGMKVMLIIAYCPAWLSYNGKTNGVPKDYNVYADILRKVYERYCQYVDWVEIYNEPGYFLTIEGSPYTSVGAALADIYMTCAEVVRSITPDMPLGGTSVVTHSDGGVGGSTNRDFFADKRINKENFNFYSHHVYGDYGIATTEETVTRVKQALSVFGYGDLPVYFTEWSTSINQRADSVTYTGTKSHLFVGTCLVNWMRDGITGAQHWNYLQAIAENGSFESGISTDAHGMYSWNPRTKEGRLLPKAYVFRLLSKTLGFGKGENQVVRTDENTDGLLNILTAINSDGNLATAIVNESVMPVEIELSVADSLSSLVQYTVTYTERGESGLKIEPDTSGKYRITVHPMSVTGLKYEY